ncbi:MAG TPA: RNA polymerase factor sigma-54 [Kaistiaceae bacterium]|nr:RNA polymerase factor sigma-54 [Kaistiaceae bacterium]
MALSPKLEMRQSQSLVMTPQLMQAIKLLQLSNLDLTAYVESELERNPLLERSDAEGGGEGAGTANEGGEAEPVDRSAADRENGTEPWLSTDLPDNAATIADRLDTDLGNVYPDDNAGPDQAGQQTYSSDPWSQVSSRGSGGSGEDYNLEAFVAGETSLADHLSMQLAMALDDPVDRMIGQYLIDCVDESGYLRTDLAAAAERLGVSIERISSVLAILHGFDPAGVAARDLAECLALQLIERDRYDPAMQTLVANLELVAKRDFAQLRRLCGVDEEDLTDMLAELKRLNPRPGNAFGSTPVQPLVPDVLVRAGPDGGWLIELNSETLPKVLVNQVYFTQVARNARSDAEKSYLNECLQTANWLVKSLDQRARTILKVSSEIVRQQDGFLTMGVEYLRPLNLRTVADAIGMHESTVSRVTSNKYMATNRGIFELKYFFTSAIASSEGGEAHSAEAVRHRIKQLIDAESPDDILSDDTIVKVLKDSGVDIARRTVAKYREAMRIPSSVQRRREKKQP